MPTGVYVRTEKIRKSLSNFKKGKSFPWLHNEKVYKKISATLTGLKRLDLKKEKHHAWKGDDASYFAIHAWILREYGKANHCENMSCYYPRTNSRGIVLYKPKRFEWALIHGEKHGHRRESYMQLCASCHRKYDEK